MVGSFQSIFSKRKSEVPAPPGKDKSLMRALEPRILLDAAAVETALDIAGQAAHSQFADDYMEQNSGTGDADDGSNAPQAEQPYAESENGDELDIAPRRSDREIVFIDAAVEDHESLIASLEPGVSVHIIEPDSDGVLQIAQILSESDGYDAIHIFSHGSSGALQLGSAVLDAGTISGSHNSALAQIGKALSESGDILIYGCDFGSGKLGQQTAELLSRATGADIAASDDLTGSESLAGDWNLEVQVGAIQARSFTLPDWEGILPGYELQPTAPPTIGHLDDGIVGTANTTATWSDAVTFDPGGGDPIQTYDIRATLIGLSDGMSATFETVPSSNGSMDDFRVVVTNIGPVVGSEVGQDIIDEGSVVVRWAIYEAGTNILAPPDQMDIIFTDIEGLAGLPDNRETVAIESEEVVSYTVNAGSDLQVGDGWGGLTASGTEQGVNAVGSHLGVSWASSNQFVVTYTSRTLITNFDMDGDGGLGVFPTPQTTKTQVLDLNGSAPGEDHIATYYNGSQLGLDADVPVSLVDMDMSIFDFDSGFLEEVTVTLTNPSAGDQLNFDSAMLVDLGIFANLIDTGTEQVLRLSGTALISNYETALRSISFSNINPDGSFDQTTPRVIEFSFFDGILDSDPVQTTINFNLAGQNPVAATNVYVEDEDMTIVASVANGLLSNDSDPQGDVITIIGAMDAQSKPISLNNVHIMPSGAMLTLNADGSFTYIPPDNYSGNETITYTISDGTFTAGGSATFDIQPVIDPVALTVDQPVSVANEDQSSAPIDVSVFSPDASEVQIVLASNIPQGVVLTDGSNTFRAGDDIYEVDITHWDRTQIRVLPVQNSDQDVAITFITENFEVDGSISFDSQTVTFEFDAVADTPILIVEQAFGGIDEDVSLAEIISVKLFDIDGSESLTDITISNIPVGAQLLVESVPLTIVGGSASFAATDIANLVFRPPVTGNDVVYNLTVSATATEVAPENNVAQLAATRAGVGLRIELNNDDDPVVAVDDQASTFAGETVNIDVLQNDFIPDGSPQITEVNGTPIDVATPVVLPGGQGQVLLSPFGYIVFEASETFAGEVKFNYTVRDADFSTDTGIVTVAVEPRWKISSIPNVVEGDSARFIMTIEGGVAQGDVISTELELEEGTTTAADHAALFAAISDSIVNLGQTDFDFDGTTLTYAAPAANYTADYDPASGEFFDISATGDALNLGNDAMTERSLGFDFNFYADTFNSVYISANGYLTFGSPGVGFDNESLDGSALAGRPIIAPFWDDLNTASGNVYVEAIGTIEGERQFIIQWDGVQNLSDGPGTGTFQVILSEAGDEIIFNYNDLTFDGVGDDGAGATIGLQSSDGVSDEFSHDVAGTIVGGSSISFTREANTDVEMYIDIPIIDDSNFEDIEDFTLRISNSVNSAISVDNASVTIAVSDNQAPIVMDDIITTQETGTGFVNVITNPAGLDLDAEGHALQIAEVDGVIITAGTAVTLSSGATVGVNLNGGLTYNPNGAFAHLAESEAGLDSFTYKVVDAFGAVSATAATVTVNIVGENQTAVVDLNDDGSTSVTTNQITYGPLETTMNIAAADATILDLDDTELSALDISLAGFDQPGNEKSHLGGTTLLFGTPLNTTVLMGTTLFRVVYDGANEIDITRDGGGEMPIFDLQDLVRDISYENDSDDDTRGTRTFTFVATDDDGPGTPSVSQVYVVGNNVAPVAMDDGVGSPYVTVEDTSIMITVAALLSNDSDIDLNPIDIVAVNGAPNGSAVLDGAGNVVYTPGADFVGATTFTYTLDDGEGGQDTGTVHVQVTPVNDAPRLDLNGLLPDADHTFTYVENDPATSMFRLSGGLIDVDNANLTGAEVVLTNGQIDDVFSFGTLPAGIVASLVPAEAATGLTAPTTVTIQFSGTASVEDYEDALRSVGFSSLSDVPSEVDRLVSVTATDGLANSTEVYTTIEIQRVNDVPDTGLDGPLSFDEDTSITITPASLLANDFDADGETLTIVSVQDATNGDLVVNGDGDYVFTSYADYFGPASFTYTVEDGSGGVVVETVSLIVNSVNDKTVITLDTGSGDGNYDITYIENDPGHALVDSSILLEDVDHSRLESATIELTNGQIGDILEFGLMPPGISASAVPPTALTSPEPIIITLSGTATLENYQDALQLLTFRSISDAPSVVDRIVSITVNDGIDDSNVGTTTIEVIAVNDAPIANDDNSISFDEDNSRIILPAELIDNDVDPDGDTITIVSVQASTNGNAELNLDGTITFTPALNYFGPASFTYTIDDGNLEQDTATVNLTIHSVNDLPQIDLDAANGGTGFATKFVENGTEISVVDSTISIDDVDHLQLQSATVFLTNGQIGDQLAVGSLPDGIAATIVPSVALTAPGTISVTLTGAESLLDFQDALKAVTYVSQSDNPSTVDRILSITANDGMANSAAVISTIEVEAVNDAPVAGTDGVYSFDEDTEFSITAAELLLNDDDAENDTLDITLVQNPSNGLVSITAGVISFTPTANYFGPASFEYVVVDGNGGADIGVVNLMVDSVNDAPVVDLDANTGGPDFETQFIENGAAKPVVDASINISDVEGQDLQGASIVLINGQPGDSLSVASLPLGIGAIVTPPGALTAAGSVNVQLTGTADAATYQTALQAISYSSNSDDPGSADRTVFVTVSDGISNSVSATTTIEVQPVNDAPQADDDGIFTTDEDTPLVLSTGDLTANDSDPENDALTIVSVQDPINGLVSLSPLGLVTFTPDLDYSGPASFTYTVEDAQGEPSIATVNISVSAVNDLPTADLNQGQSGIGHVTSYLENDVGRALVDASVVLADVDSPGITQATFELTNGNVGDILEVGTLPTGIGATVVPTGALTAPGTITVTLSGDATREAYALALQAVTYRSNSDRPDPDDRNVNLVLNDGDDDSDPISTTISIIVINDEPVAGPDGVFTFNEDEVFVLPASTLLANDTDSDLDTLSIQSVQSAVNGTVHLDPGGSVVFTPNLSYWGPASFTYTVSDGFGGSDTATVNLNVLILNDLPIIDLDGGTDGVGFVTDYAENGAGVAIVNTDISIFDEDHANLQSATITLTNGQVGDILEIGSLPGTIAASVVPSTALTAAGSVTVTLTGAAQLLDYEAALKELTFRSVSESPDTTDRTIEFVLSDGIDPSIAVATTVRVESINDAPVAGDDGSPTPLAVTEDTPLTFNPVLSNDSDVEGDALFITEIDSDPVSPGDTVLVTNGSVDLALDGTTLTFNPAPNYFGPASFSYQISDGNLTDTAMVYLNVAPVNDAPVASDDGPVALVEDGSVFIDPVTPNDTDVESDPLSITSIDGTPIAPLGFVLTTDGRINLGADGRTLEFVPNAQFNGPTVVSYQISDGQLTSTANVTFDVSAVDDPLSVAATPPDVAFDDGDTVNLPMVGYFTDPDGDDLTYSVTGLPIGLSIHPEFGVISGDIDSSASQTSPYSVTVTVDDGQGSIVSTGFEMDVTNIAPTVAANFAVVVRDGDDLSIDAAASFVDADRDNLTFIMTGLPAWAGYDADSGLITGVAPANASDSGPSIVTVTADDGDGGSEVLEITIEPENVAPVATSAVENIEVQEQDLVDMDISGLFVDGGFDNDPISVAVTGLPDGLTHDALGGRIVGEVASGSYQNSPYLVTITADDGQGGNTEVDFIITIGNSSSFVDDNPLVDFSDLIEFDDLTEEDTPKIGETVGNAVDEIAGLNGINPLDGKDGIVLSTIAQIDPLHEATLSGSDEGLHEQIDAMNAMANSTDWLNESGRQGNGDWSVAGTFGYFSLTDDGSPFDATMRDERLDRVGVEAIFRQGALYVEFKNLLDPERDGRIVSATFSYPGGGALPDWMKVIRSGFISAVPPQDANEIVLDLTVVLDTGKDLLKRVLIDVKSGAVIEIDEQPAQVDAVENKTIPPESAKGAEKRVGEELKPHQMRGSIDEFKTPG